MGGGGKSNPFCCECGIALMYLVISNWMGEVHVSKEANDPCKSISYKSRAASITAIIALTPLADDLPLEVLKQMFLEGMFTKPSRFKQEE